MAGLLLHPIALKMLIRRSRNKGRKGQGVESTRAVADRKSSERAPAKEKKGDHHSSPRGVVENGEFESSDDRYSSRSEEISSSEHPSPTPNRATPKRKNSKGATIQTQDKYCSPNQAPIDVASFFNSSTDDRESWRPKKTPYAGTRKKIPAEPTSKRKNANGTGKQSNKSNRSSARKRDEDDDSFSDESSDNGDSTGSNDTSYSSTCSSYETTYVGDPGEDLVDMIKDVFSGPKDDGESLTSSKGGDSYSLSSSKGGDDDSTTYKSKSYNKLCHKLGLNDASLVEITVECDAILKETAQKMAQLLPKNSRLKKLCLVLGRDKRHWQIFRFVLSGLAGSTSISQLEIRGPKGATKDMAESSVVSTSESLLLDRESSSWLGTSLSKNQSVQKIFLKDCQFVDSGLAVLFLGIHHSNIREIVITSCDLMESDTDVVSASLPLLMLTSLSLVDTLLTKESLRFLCDNMEKTPTLTYINLSRHDLGQHELAVLSKCLKRHEQLNELVLSSCSIDDAGVNELAKGLKRNSAVSTLDLSQNEFGDRGASYLKGLIEINTAIKELRVDGCKIKSRKMLTGIANVLRYNNSILKSFGISATTSSAIFQSVDTLEEMGGMISSSVSEVVNMS